VLCPMGNPSWGRFVMKRIIYLIPIVLMLALVGNAEAVGINVSDNFNDNSIDPSIWTVNSSTPTETAGIMRINSASRITAKSRS